jgi:CheY-like chemotaxis protein
MKIFLSSTYLDLIEYRAAAANAFERLGQQGVRMEVFGARPTDATSVCFDEMIESDAMVGIYAHRYGHIPTGHTTSITEQEFDFARSKEKPVFCFLIDQDYPWPPRFIDADQQRAALAAFKGRIQSQIVTETITTPHDLAFKLASSLGRFLLARRVKKNLDQIPKIGSSSTESAKSQVARRIARLGRVIEGAKVLLVNDVPDQMRHVVALLREVDIDVRVCEDSESALKLINEVTFDAIISDMERHGVQDEGIRFLNNLRGRSSAPPVIFTVGRFDPARGTPAFAFGVTNRVDECLNLLFDALERVRG